MIWRSFRHVSFVELTAVGVLLLLAWLLSLAGINLGAFEKFDTAIGLLLWVGSCLLIYRFRYGRL